jgi:hypothetical protein
MGEFIFGPGSGCQDFFWFWCVWCGVCEGKGMLTFSFCTQGVFEDPNFIKRP